MTAKYTTTIRIILAALAISMLGAGPNMALIKQHQGYAASQTKQQEQSIIQNLHGNFAKRSADEQHKDIDQENQCGKCGNAVLGEQTLGNDNSVTGFSDQSKNVQNRVVITPTPKVTPTPTPTITPTPIGTPMTGTLHVTKDCEPPCPPTLAFPFTVTGNNPQPSSFSLGDLQTQTVSLGPGSFTVTEPPVSEVSTLFSGDCKETFPGSGSANGTISAGQTLTCDIENGLTGP